MVTVQISGAIHPVIGVVLVCVALVYLVVLTVQVFKKNDRSNDSQEFECVNDSEYYTELSYTDGSSSRPL